MGYDLSTAEFPSAEQVEDYLKAVQTSEYVIPQGRPDLPQDYIDTVERKVQYWKKRGGRPPPFHALQHLGLWRASPIHFSIHVQSSFALHQGKASGVSRFIRISQ